MEDALSDEVPEALDPVDLGLVVGGLEDGAGLVGGDEPRPDGELALVALHVLRHVDLGDHEAGLEGVAEALVMGVVLVVGLVPVPVPTPVLLLREDEAEVEEEHLPLPPLPVQQLALRPRLPHRQRLLEQDLKEGLTVSSTREGRKGGV